MHNHSISTWTDWLWNITTMPFNLFFIFVVIVWSVWEHLSIGPALRNLSKPDKVLSLVNISGFSIGHIQRFSTGQHIHFSTDTKYVQSFSTGSINRYEQHAKFRHYTCIYVRVGIFTNTSWTHFQNIDYSRRFMKSLIVRARAQI